MGLVSKGIVIFTSRYLKKSQKLQKRHLDICIKYVIWVDFHLFLLICLSFNYGKGTILVKEIIKQIKNRHFQFFFTIFTDLLEMSKNGEKTIVLHIRMCRWSMTLCVKWENYNSTWKVSKCSYFEFQDFFGFRQLVSYSLAKLQENTYIT